MILFTVNGSAILALDNVVLLQLGNYLDETAMDVR
jgi:hypothetical protein